MKKLLLLAVLATGAATASAQTGTPAGTAKKGKDSSYGPASAATIAPNGPVSSGPRPGQKINTAPATGANRASRSSSTLKAARQGRPTASDDMQSMPKNSAARPGKKRY